MFAATPYEPNELIEMINRLLETEFIKESIKERVVNTAERLKHEGIQEGRREGRQEGRREMSAETARRLLDRGFTVADVAEITGLTEGEVRDILGFHD